MMLKKILGGYTEYSSLMCIYSEEEENVKIE